MQKIVEENNILYVENKCTKIEFEKYFINGEFFICVIYNIN